MSALAAPSLPASETLVPDATAILHAENLPGEVADFITRRILEQDAQFFDG